MMIDEDIFSTAVSRRNDYRIVFTILSCLSLHIILYFTLCWHLDEAFENVFMDAI